MQKQRQTNARGRSVLISAVLAGLVIAGTAACGDFPRSNTDPLTESATAQSIVEQFVDTYNEAGVADAVEQTFCSDDVAANEGRESFGDSEFTAGSMQITSPASTGGGNGHAGVSVSGAASPVQNYTVQLRKDDAQGWCITGLSPVTG
ncbi:hypothetical protein [Gordonia caeni]|uniref:hypothetical protein n=1 Tax=Gordonia caeni TaxID=1007097 RepID=UPI0031DEFC1C